MTSINETEDLIAGLVGDLEPRRPLPPLRVVVAGVSVAALALGIAGTLFRADLAAVQTWSWLATGAHLLLAGGALLAALAACIPGREEAERVGSRTAVAGGVVTLLVGAFVALEFAQPTALTWVSVLEAAKCTSVASLFAIVPVSLVAYFAGRAAPRSPFPTLWTAAVAALAFGTLPVHLGCTGGAMHSLFGHFLAPFTASLVVVAVAWPVYRRVSGRGA